MSLLIFINSLEVDLCPCSEANGFKARRNPISYQGVVDSLSLFPSNFLSLSPPLSSNSLSQPFSSSLSHKSGLWLWSTTRSFSGNEETSFDIYLKKQKVTINMLKLLASVPVKKKKKIWIMWPSTCIFSTPTDTDDCSVSCVIYLFSLLIQQGVGTCCSSPPYTLTSLSPGPTNSQFSEAN